MPSQYRIDAPLVPARTWQRVRDDVEGDLVTRIWQREAAHDRFGIVNAADLMHQPCTIVEVGPRAPRGLRRAIYDVARMFRREFGFDFIQYAVIEDGDDADRVIAWVENRHGDARLLGAACFRWREYSDAPAGFALAWVWLHPYWRRQGLLRAAWSALRLRFGDFDVEGPLSPAMAAFLQAVEPLLPETA